jgi:4'-phosphopantetheinyl transferase
MLPTLINVFYCQFECRLDEKALDQYLKLVPPLIQQQIRRYEKWQDRQAVLIGKLILKNVLKHFSMNDSLEDIKYSLHRKPFLSSGIKFNISHSEDFVVCVVSNSCDVGVDIERIRPISVYDFKAQMTEGEWNYVLQQSDLTIAFYKYWTAKESVIKADGRGLNIPLNSFEIITNITIIDDVFWYTRELFIDDSVSCHVATNTPNFELCLFAIANPFEFSQITLSKR